MFSGFCFSTFPSFLIFLPFLHSLFLVAHYLFLFSTFSCFSVSTSFLLYVFFYLLVFSALFLCLLSSEVLATSLIVRSLCLGEEERKKPSDICFLPFLFVCFYIYVSAVNKFCFLGFLMIYIYSRTIWISSLSGEHVNFLPEKLGVCFSLEKVTQIWITKMLITSV